MNTETQTEFTQESKDIFVNHIFNNLEELKELLEKDNALANMISDMITRKSTEFRLQPIEQTKYVPCD